MSQPTDTHERLQAGDEVLIRLLGHPVTINEVHALLLGTTGLVIGYVLPLLGPLLPLYAVLGRPRLHSLPHSAVEYHNSIGLHTVRHEPWWTLGSYIPLFFVGVWLCSCYGSLGA